MALKRILFCRDSPSVGQGLLIHEVSRSHTKRLTTVGTTPLDELSTRRRDLYLTTQKTDMGQTSMPPSRIRTRNPSKSAATGIGMHCRNTLYMQFPCG